MISALPVDVLFERDELSPRATRLPHKPRRSPLQLRSGLVAMAPSRGPQALPRTLHHTLQNHKGPVHVVRYAKGSAKYILSGGQDRTIRLWNPALGTEIKSYAGHGYEVLSITVYVQVVMMGDMGSRSC